MGRRTLNFLSLCFIESYDFVVLQRWHDEVMLLLFVVVLGDTCTTELQCTHSVNYSRCFEGYCSCLPGHRQDIIDGTLVNNSCIRRKLSRPAV